VRTVAFFNHKGGVGKSTLVVNLGLALAAEGKRVLFLDADPQANLTSAVIEMTRYERLLENEHTIFGALADMIRGTGDIAPVGSVKIRPSAWIVPGDIRLSRFEDELPINWTSAQSGAPRGLLVSSAIHRLIRHEASRVGAELVLVDVGPSVGALNRSILMGADGFVVPLSPDLFSLTALASVGSSLIKWIDEWRVVLAAARRNRFDHTNELPLGEPSPLGYVSQQFVSYRQAPAAAFQRWNVQIPDAYRTGIYLPLRDAGVSVPAGDEMSLGEVKNLSSLIPMAQQQNKAIFELTGTQARGAQYTRAVDTLDLFISIAKRMLGKLDEVS
jgi:chromosome partitioning protein